MLSRIKKKLGGGGGGFGGRWYQIGIRCSIRFLKNFYLHASLYTDINQTRIQTEEPAFAPRTKPEKTVPSSGEILNIIASVIHIFLFCDVSFIRRVYFRPFF